MGPMKLVGEYHKVVDEIRKKVENAKELPKDIQRGIVMALQEDVYDLARVKSILPLLDESVIQKVAWTRKAYEALVDESLHLLKTMKASGAHIPENFESDLIRFRSNPNFFIGLARDILDEVKMADLDQAAILLGTDTGNFELVGFIRDYDKLVSDVATLLEQPGVGQDIKNEVSSILDSNIYDDEPLIDIFFRLKTGHF